MPGTSGSLHRTRDEIPDHQGETTRNPTNTTHEARRQKCVQVGEYSLVSSWPPLLPAGGAANSPTFLPHVFRLSGAAVFVVVCQRFASLLVQIVLIFLPLVPTQLSSHECVTIVRVLCLLRRPLCFSRTGASRSPLGNTFLS